ncbi:unnamed protein product [Closterium sp. NIES-54]
MRASWYVSIADTTARAALPGGSTAAAAMANDSTHSRSLLPDSSPAMATESKQAKDTKAVAPESLWDTIRGVVFVLGVAVAFTLSLTVLASYESAIARVSYKGHRAAVSAAATAPRREPEAEETRPLMMAA